jgi:hypothetical protein
MNVILRNSTRRMIDQSRASVEAEGFIAWLRTDGYTDYVIDCHIRRLLFVLPKLSSGTAPPTLRDADLVAVFGRERRPLTRFTNFASTRRVYSRYLRAQGRSLHPHSIRHSTAVALLKSGVDFATISQWLGHAGLNTTMRYARADLDLKRRALAQVFPDAVTPPPGGRLLLDRADLVGWLRRL